MKRIYHNLLTSTFTLALAGVLSAYHFPNQQYVKGGLPDVHSASGEKDTLIMGKNGTKVHIPSGTFAPHKIKDIQFEIKEYIDRCELFALNLEMTSDKGEYLVSEGVIYLSARKDGKNLVPQKNIEVWIPSVKIDTTMLLFTATQNFDGNLLWKRTNIPLEFHITRSRYYSFSTMQLGWFNVERPLENRFATLFQPKTIDKKTAKMRYNLKNNCYQHPMVRIIFADSHNYFELPEGPGGTFSMAKVDAPEKTIVVSRVLSDDGRIFYFAKRLSELEQKKGYYWINREDYIVRKPVDKNLTKAPFVDDLLKGLCERIIP